MNVGRAHLEASAERWSRLLGLLEELWRWICMKDEELAKQMPIGGDVPTLLQQQNYCTVSSVAVGDVPATLYKISHTLSLTLFNFRQSFSAVKLTFFQNTLGSLFKKQPLSMFSAVCLTMEHADSKLVKLLHTYSMMSYISGGNNYDIVIIIVKEPYQPATGSGLLFLLFLSGFCYLSPLYHTVSFTAPAHSRSYHHCHLLPCFPLYYLL